MRFFIFIILSCLFLLTSCKKEGQTSSQLHADYFPLEEGSFVIYNATEITHDQAALQHDTLHYFLKTIVGSIYFDNEGRAAREIFRYKRPDSTAIWQLTDVWTAVLDGNRVEQVEENERIVKLLLPPTFTKEWNLNIFNTKAKQNARYTSIHEPFSIQGNAFDSALTVEQADFLSFVDYQKQFEVYAKGVGLISKYFKDLTIDNFDTLNVVKGKELYYNCISFGME